MNDQGRSSIPSSAKDRDVIQQTDTVHGAWCMFVACLGTESRRHVFHGGANEAQGLRQCVLFHIHVREELLHAVKLCIISSDEWDIARYDYTDAARWAVTMSG